MKLIDGYILDAPLSYHRTGELPPEGFEVISFSSAYLKSHTGNDEWHIGPKNWQPYPQRFEEAKNEQQRNNK